MQAELPVDVAWCADPRQSAELARFFADNVTPEYISHSELQGPRALDEGHWRPGLADIFESEIKERIIESGGRVDLKAASRPIFAARCGGRLVGFGMASFFPDAPVPYGIVEDIVVEQSGRDCGIGKAVLDWVTREAEAVSCQRLFLESGTNNDRAHHFFEREGFEVCSVVMMKRLDPSRR